MVLMAPAKPGSSGERKQSSAKSSANGGGCFWPEEGALGARAAISSQEHVAAW